MVEKSCRNTATRMGKNRNKCKGRILQNPSVSQRQGSGKFYIIQLNFKIIFKMLLDNFDKKDHKLLENKAAGKRVSR